MLVSELLNEQFLVEKLGTLRSLNVGSMINILKQHNRSSNKYGNETSATANKFGGEYGGVSHIGSESEIVDVGVIKGGIGGLRKAYKAHENALAFALYVDNKAVAFGTFSIDTLAGSSRAGVFAFDLSQFKDKIEANAEERRKQAKFDWEKNNIKARDISSYHEKTRRNYRTGKDEIEKYHGNSTSTASLKAFLEELVMLAGDKPITCKLVLSDDKAREKRKERYAVKVTKNDLLTGLDALKTRLQKYKISKKPTAKNIDEFMEMIASGAAKVVQFAGRGYNTTAETGYSFDKISPLSLLNGTPFEIRYKSVDPGSYESLNISYMFNKDDGTLKPFKAEWSDKESGNKETAALEPESYLKHELGVKSLDKDSIIKAILVKVKANAFHNAKEMIAAARKAGYDYPEFNAIQKSIDASEKKQS